MEFSIGLTFTDVMSPTIGCVTKFASCQRI